MKINFKITTECPANCKCCQERLNNFKTNTEHFLVRDSRVYERILRLFLDSGDTINSISITGGEPSIIPELPDIVRMFTKNGISVGVDTNGWNVTDAWLSEMEKAQLDYVLVSFYSRNKDVFDMLRGSEGTELFFRVSRALTALKGMKKAGGAIKVRQQVTLMKANYKELPDLLQLALANQFDAISTAYYISASEDPMIAMDESDIIFFKNEVVEQLKRILYESGMDRTLLVENIERLDHFYEFDGVPLSKVARGFYRKNGEMCFNMNKLVIYPNGDVVPCTGYDYVMKKTDSVNILDFNYKQIMESPLFADFWSVPFPLCERCSGGYQIWLDLNKTEV